MMGEKSNQFLKEFGVIRGNSEYTWIVDPLDGTANYAAGIPWFGVMITVLKGKTVMAGVMYIPSSDILYYSEKGKGVMRNDVRIHVSAETELRNI